MNVMIIGSGGREHALLKALQSSPEISRFYALPGNSGMASIAQCVPIRAMDIDGMVAFAKSHEIGFAVVAPDDPLAAGAVDRLEAIGIACFGPTARAALIESSKAFAKDLMKKYGIPTANYRVFDKADQALAFIRSNNAYPIVIKADGLALGKGVCIAQTQGEAEQAVLHAMRDGAFGASGATIVVEEFLTGPEVSVLAFTDSKTIVPMVSSMDHKRALNGDMGPNTGGMGTVAPNPYYTKEIADTCMRDIFLPTMHAMNREGRPFKGCLYFGLMLTDNGPKVIEYNCRFGDPETQVVLPLLETDLFTIMRATAEERLDEIDIRFRDEAACCVILASGGYPGAYKTGKPIQFGAMPDNVSVYHAGTAFAPDGGHMTSGGRVLGVTAVAPALKQAIADAYLAAGNITFENKYLRSDIGQKALQASQG